MATPLTASLPTRMRVMKSSAESEASARSNVSTSAPLSPLAASRRSLVVSSVSRNSGTSGRRKRRGCGSKVSATAGPPRACARAVAAPITARWPRCTPSKLPIAITPPLNAATAAESSRTTRNGRVEPAGSLLWNGSGKAADRAVRPRSKSSRPPRHRDHGLAVEHQVTVDQRLAFEPHPPALRDEFDHFDDDGDHVADLDRRVEVERLRAIDRAGAGQPGAEHRRDQACGVEPVGNALAEPGMRRINIAEVDRILVSREFGEADHVGIHHGFHQDFAQADMEILEIEDFQHARVDGGLWARH